MPSRSEGLSRAITEAMERGVCPVVTRVGGTPELVRDGVDGLVISPEDDEALASAIMLLARQPALRQSLAASVASGSGRIHRRADGGADDGDVPHAAGVRREGKRRRWTGDPAVPGAGARLHSSTRGLSVDSCRTPY